MELLENFEADKLGIEIPREDSPSKPLLDPRLAEATSALPRLGKSVSAAGTGSGSAGAAAAGKRWCAGDFCAFDPLAEHAVMEGEGDGNAGGGYSLSPAAGGNTGGAAVLKVDNHTQNRKQRYFPFIGAPPPSLT